MANCSVSKVMGRVAFFLAVPVIMIGVFIWCLPESASNPRNRPARPTGITTVLAPSQQFDGPAENTPAGNIHNEKRSMRRRLPRVNGSDGSADAVPWCRRTFNYSQPDHIVPGRSNSSPQAGEEPAELVERGKKSEHFNNDIKIVVTNATPFRWRKVHQQAFEVPNWEEVWPQHIRPGEAASQVIKQCNGKKKTAAEAEVMYRLEGTSKPLAFTLQYRKGKPHSVWVRFEDELETFNNKRHSEQELGYHAFPSGVSFILAGAEAEFVSNNAPAAWMQAQMPWIGDLSLRELVLPRTHHTGLDRVWKVFELASLDNTKTQDMDFARQLDVGGVRVIDARTCLYKFVFYESHGSKVLGLWHGTLGSSFLRMVDLINKFNKRHPGELIIWDIHPTDVWDANKGFGKLGPWAVYFLYETFKELEHRLPVPDDEDITRWPVRRFIGGGKPAVLIRFDESFRKQYPHWPGGKEGFVTNRNFPLNHHWSNMDGAEAMFQDQVAALQHGRPTREAAVYNADWLRSQIGIGALLPAHSLLQMSEVTWPALFDVLWNATTDQTYPNWIAIDGLQGGELKSLAMAMNACLGARRCGRLEGKVKGELAFEPKVRRPLASGD